VDNIKGRVHLSGQGGIIYTGWDVHNLFSKAEEGKKYRRINLKRKSCNLLDGLWIHPDYFKHSYESGEGREENNVGGGGEIREEER